MTRRGFLTAVLAIPAAVKAGFVPMPAPTTEAGPLTALQLVVEAQAQRNQLESMSPDTLFHRLAATIDGTYVTEAGEIDRAVYPRLP